MRQALLIAVLVLTVAPMGEGQTQSTRDSHQTSVEEVIKRLDNERIQAQIHADATALDRIYAADFIGVARDFGPFLSSRSLRSWLFHLLRIFSPAPSKSP